MKIRAWLISVFTLIIVVSALAGTKLLQFKSLSAAAQSIAPPVITVTASAVTAQTWGVELQTVGSFTAVEGVTVSSDLPGKVTVIRFTPGTTVEKGEILVVQDTAPEQAQLREAEASVELARLELERNRLLLSSRAGSKADFDSSNAALQEAQARADGIRATIQRKTIRAPFAGRLGIRQVNLGQVLGENDPVVSLQTIDPIFINFVLPQRHFSQLKPGMKIQAYSDAVVQGGKPQPIDGTITTISPEVDVNTRNIAVQATVANPDGAVLSGMSTSVTVLLDEQDQVLAVPMTAVLNAAFGDSVFVIEASGGKQTVRQQFVRLGRRFGDFVAIDSGVEVDQQVVSSGVFKLRTGESVTIDNSLQPQFELQPKPDNS